MARRVYISSGGMRVGPPGVDAATAAPSSLLFNTVEQQLFLAGSGTTPALTTSGVVVLLEVPCSDAPLVWCWCGDTFVPENKRVVKTLLGPGPPYTYFIAYAETLWDGSAPAAGFGATWAAFVRSRH